MLITSELLGIEPSQTRAHRLIAVADQLGVQLRTFGGRETALAYLKAQTKSSAAPSAIVINDQVQGSYGYGVIHEIATTYPDIPLVVASNSAEAADRLLARTVGADGFVRLHNNDEDIPLLVAAIKAASTCLQHQSSLPALLTFQHWENSNGVRKPYKLEIDTINKRVYKNGKEEILTKTEMNVLIFMAANADKFLSRESILIANWGFIHDINTRTIDVHVFNIRRKIESQPTKPKLVLTVNGIGYRFANPQQAEDDGQEDSEESEEDMETASAGSKSPSNDLAGADYK